MTCAGCLVDLSDRTIVLTVTGHLGVEFRFCTKCWLADLSGRDQLAGSVTVTAPRGRSRKKGAL